MVAKLDSDSGLPVRPPGSVTNTSNAITAEAAPSTPKPARQPKCVARKVMSGRPPATASDQPRKTKAMALGRCASGTIRPTVAAACGV